MTSLLLAATFAIPLLLAVLVCLPPLRHRALPLAALATLPALATAFLPGTAGSTTPLGLPPGVHVGLDGIGRTFLGFTAAVWALAALHAIGYMRSDSARLRFSVAFLVTMAGNFGLIIAQDAVSFYTCFAVMSLGSYALVIHDRTPFARYASLVYLVLVILGELLIFPGLVIGSCAAGSIQLQDIRLGWSAAGLPALPMVLLFVGFAVKAGIMPLHVWLPLAHPAAPTPASAVLSGCMIKAGLLAWIRFLPIGEIAMPLAAKWALGAGAVTMLASLAIGLMQDNPKAILAYSSISKMGTLLLLLAFAMAVPATAGAALAAVAAYAAFHAFNKGALFLGCSITPNLGSRTCAGRLALAGVIILALSFAGAPWLAGAAAKLPIKKLLAADAEPIGHVIKQLLTISAFATGLLMARFILMTRPGNTTPAHRPDRFEGLAWLLGIVSVLAFPALMVGFDLHHLLLPVYRANIGIAEQTPLLLAVLCTMAWFIRPWKLAWKIPPGDLVSALTQLRRFLPTIATLQHNRVLSPDQRPQAGDAWHRRLRRRLEQKTHYLEAQIENTPAGGAIFVFIVIALLLAILGDSPP